MRPSRVFRIACLATGTLLGNSIASAQFPVPKLPGFGKKKDSRPPRKGDEGGQSTAQGVPIPADSPIFVAFGQLEQQKVYHQRMTITTDDPRMQELMTQMGFGPAETITAGDVKQVSMHFQMPLGGKTEDMELRGVIANGKFAKKWISPGSDRFLAQVDANTAKQLAQMEEQSAKSIARSLSQGPMGLASAAVSAAGVAASVAAVGHARKTAHDFFEWTCGDAPSASAAPASHREPPPMTDLKVIGDQSVDGVAATAYEFFVRQDGRYQGPMQLFIAKDSGLPLRIAMNDPRAGGGMHMDYFGFNQGGDFEIPACMADHK